MKYLIIFASALILILSGCSEKSRQAGRAEEVGQIHAVRLIESLPLDEMKLQDYLLGIRANEWELRKAGNPDAADRYIKSFQTTVTELDSAFAAEIFQSGEEIVER